MLKNTGLFAAPLAAAMLFAISANAHAQSASSQLRLAQAGPGPQSDEAAPPEEDGEKRGRKGRKRDKENGPPPGAGGQPPARGAEGGPPQQQKGPPGQKRRKAAEGAEKKPGPPPAKVQAPAEAPVKPQAPARAQAPDGPPPGADKERRRKQAQPGPNGKPERKRKMQAAPQQMPQPEAPRAPAKTVAPPPQPPKPQPQETQMQGPKPQRQETQTQPAKPQRQDAQTQGPGPRDKSAKPRREAQRGFPGGNMENIKKQRRQRTEDGGKRTVIEEPGNRVIVKEGGEARIRHDETERLRRTSKNVRRERGKDGNSLTIAVRPGGIEIYSEFDNDGRLLRRYRRGRDGREMNLIDNRRFRGDRGHRDRNGFGFYVDLRPPRIGIPRNRYIVEYDGASEEDIYDALMAPPIEELDRGYSLDEVRYNRNLRDRMRRVDLDTVNFAFGSWEVAESQYDKLERIARVINRILDRRPDEIFLVEGHTDAVGSDVDNLTLSDRRAEEVAYILTESFDVPPENLVTQGYGEEYLKIDTPEPERANRRVAVRRITPLMSRR